MKKLSCVLVWSSFLCGVSLYAGGMGGEQQARILADFKIFAYQMDKLSLKVGTPEVETTFSQNEMITLPPQVNLWYMTPKYGFRFEWFSMSGKNSGIPETVDAAAVASKFARDYTPRLDTYIGIIPGLYANLGFGYSSHSGSVKADTVSKDLPTTTAMVLSLGALYQYNKPSWEVETALSLDVLNSLKVDTKDVETKEVFSRSMMKLWFNGDFFYHVSDVLCAGAGFELGMPLSGTLKSKEEGVTEEKLTFGGMGFEVDVLKLRLTLQ